MKARVKKTGLPIEDLIICDDTGYQWPFDDIELISDTGSSKEIDWEQRRFELVKDLLYTVPPMAYSSDKEKFARLVVSWADAVLAEYRKGCNI